jgi:hypothetical protein
MSGSLDDEQTPTERLRAAVRHVVEHDLAGISQEDFVAADEELSLSTLRRILRPPSATYRPRPKQLAALDRAIRAHRLTEWAGADAVLAGEVPAAVTIAMIDARIDERLGRIELEAADQLADWTARLTDPVDRDFAVAVLRWLVLRRRAS